MSVIDSFLNRRYQYFLTCTEKAPEGTYQRAKEIAAEIGSLADLILERSRALDVAIDNGDGIRNIEVAIYREMLAGKGYKDDLLIAEGFGAEMGGPNADRIMEQAIRDRDFLRSMAET